MTLSPPWPPAPLEDAWRDALEATLARPVTASALARMVAQQAARYRGEGGPHAHEDGLTARLLFWFPRDVVKVARPVAELLRGGVLPTRPLRILDVGAGLGATSLGVLRALAGHRTVASIDAVDLDGAALSKLRGLYQNAASRGLLASGVTLNTLTQNAAEGGLPRGPYDLVLLGLAGVEITQGLSTPEARAEALSAVLTRLVDTLCDDGALIVIEPGSRDASRVLHHARARALALGQTVYAPCLHSGPCPMLRSEHDWCHEDYREGSLPAWLVGVARDAGLRWEGPTWSYLVLRRDRRRLVDALAPTAPNRRLLRVIEAPTVTKGKTETWLCGDLDDARHDTRALELDRVGKGHTVRLRDTRRGDIIQMSTENTRTTSQNIRLSPDDWERITFNLIDPSHG